MLPASFLLRPTYPLSAVMKTKATSFPDAAFIAAFVSVSLKDDVTSVPSAEARFEMASTGYVSAPSAGKFVNWRESSYSY